MGLSEKVVYPKIALAIGKMVIFGHPILRQNHMGWKPIIPPNTGK
jgi:hypothetical protein